MKQVFAIGILSLLTFSSCSYFGGEQVRGDGNVVTQTRSFNNFNSVDVSSAIDVYITQDSSYTIKVEADNNLQELIEVYKEGETLRIREANNVNLNPSRDIKVYVSGPVFKSLEASGASSITTQNKLNGDGSLHIGLSGASEANLDIKALRTEMDLSGACTINVRGETKEVFIDGSGACAVKAFELLSENVQVNISGATHADVYASVKVEGDASGASNVNIRGAGVISVSTSGASEARKVQ